MARDSTARQEDLESQRIAQGPAGNKGSYPESEDELARAAALLSGGARVALNHALALERPGWDP